MITLAIAFTSIILVGTLAAWLYDRWGYSTLNNPRVARILSALSSGVFRGGS